jgi:hypothetical protein
MGLRARSTPEVTDANGISPFRWPRFRVLRAGWCASRTARGLEKQH